MFATPAFPRAVGCDVAYGKSKGGKPKDGKA